MTVGRPGMLSGARDECLAVTDARRAYLAGVRRPARPRLAEARALCDEASREAAARAGTLPQRHLATHLRAKERWELFATHGLIPERWVDDPARVFPGEVCTVTPDGGLRFAPGVRLPHPATADDALAIASDAAGVASAEELAREAARRLKFAPGSPVIAWRVAPSAHNNSWSIENHDALRADELLFRTSTRPFGEVEGIGETLLEALGRGPGGYYRLDWYYPAWAWCVHEAMWDRAARDEVVVDLPQPGVRNGGRRYAYEGANPFTALVALYALGYGCAELAHEIALVAPGL